MKTTDRSSLGLITDTVLYAAALLIAHPIRGERFLNNVIDGLRIVDRLCGKDEITGSVLSNLLMLSEKNQNPCEILLELKEMQDRVWHGKEKRQLRQLELFLRRCWDIPNHQEDTREKKHPPQMEALLGRLRSLMATCPPKDRAQEQAFRSSMTAEQTRLAAEAAHGEIMERLGGFFHAIIVPQDACGEGNEK